VLVPYFIKGVLLDHINNTPPCFSIDWLRFSFHMTFVIQLLISFARNLISITSWINENRQILFNSSYFNLDLDLCKLLKEIKMSFNCGHDCVCCHYSGFEWVNMLER